MRFIEVIKSRKGKSIDFEKIKPQSAQRRIKGD